jgi:hypothetical protein
MCICVNSFMRCICGWHLKWSRNLEDDRTLEFDKQKYLYSITDDFIAAIRWSNEWIRWSNACPVVVTGSSSTWQVLFQFTASFLVSLASLVNRPTNGRWMNAMNGLVMERLGEMLDSETARGNRGHVKRVGATWITTVQDDPSLDGLQWRFLQQDQSTRQALIGLQTPFPLFLVNVGRNTGLKRETEHGRRARYPGQTHDHAPASTWPKLYLSPHRSHELCLFQSSFWNNTSVTSNSSQNRGKSRAVTNNGASRTSMRVCRWKGICRNDSYFFSRKVLVMNWLCWKGEAVLASVKKTKWDHSDCFTGVKKDEEHARHG